MNQLIHAPLTHQGYIKDNGKLPIIDPTDAHLALKMLLILNKPVAKGILKILVNNIDGPDICVTDLMILLRQEQTIVSMHLAKLRSILIVRAKRSGKSMYYSIVPQRMERVCHVVKKMSAMIDESVDVRRDDAMSFQLWRNPVAKNDN